MKLGTARGGAGDRIYRRIAWRLLPFLLLCFVVAIVDRFNISFAKLRFMADLRMDDAVFGIAAGMFSVGYVAFEVPSNLILARVGFPRTLQRIMVLWGAVTALMCFTGSAGHLYVLRFLLGVAQAGFFPGVVVYLACWFPDRHRGRVMSLFVTAVPIAGIVGGPLSGWLMDRFDGVLGAGGWRWLFLLEGLPAVLLGVVAHSRLTDRPDRAVWLSAEDKAFLARELEADRGGDPPRLFREALRDPNLYLLSAVYFAFFCSLNAILVWSPSLLSIVGVGTATGIGLWSGAISVAATAGMLAVGWRSDRTLERRKHVAGGGIAAAACLLLLSAASHSAGLTIALLMLASAGVFSVLGLFWTLPTRYLEGNASAGGIALISSIGALGGVVSPTLVGWIKVKTGSLHLGLEVVAALLLLGMLLLLCSPVGRRDRAPGLALPDSRVEP